MATTQSSRKLEGIDYVADGWTKTGARRKRKPTDAELARNFEVVAANFDAANEIRWAAGLPMIEPTFYAEALMDRMIATANSGAKKATKQRIKKAKPMAAKVPAKNGNGNGKANGKAPEIRKPDDPRTAKQVYAIAARALAVLDLEFPGTKGEASEIIQALDAMASN